MAEAVLHFKNRRQAGQKLAEALNEYRGTEAVVCGLPRGGVIIGAEIARALDLPLDFLAVRKVGHPDLPEYAIAAVSEGGELVTNELAVASVDQADFERQVERERLEAGRRRELYARGFARPTVAGKTAIVVDDGVATGLTMRSAIHDLRQRGAREIVVAVPVAPDLAVAVLKNEVARVVCLCPDPNFVAIGYYYDEFPQVPDREVIMCLRKINQHEKRIKGARGIYPRARSLSKR